MKVIKLTKLSGGDLYVNPERVICFSSAITKKGIACCVLTVSGSQLWVLEPVEVVMKALGLL